MVSTATTLVRSCVVLSKRQWRFFLRLPALVSLMTAVVCLRTSCLVSWHPWGLESSTLLWTTPCCSRWLKTIRGSWVVPQLLATSSTMVPLHPTTWAPRRTRAVWAWAVMMPPSLPLLLQVTITQAGGASIRGRTLTTVVSARSLQAEAQATLQRRQASRAPARRPLDILRPHQGTRLLRRASAARASVPHLRAMQPRAPSTRLPRQATHQPRLPMAHPPHHHTRLHLPVTPPLRRLTRPRRQATAQPRLHIVAPHHRTTARRHPRTARRRLRTALQAHSSVRTTTGAHPLRPPPRHTVLPVRSTPQQALLATQRTRLHRQSSLPRHRVRHHTRRPRQSGRQLARLTRLRKFHRSWL